MTPNEDQIPAPAASGAQPDAAQGQTAPVENPAPLVDTTDWKKRYNDSNREVTTKLKPALDMATEIAKKTGYNSVEELYAAIKEQEKMEATQPAPVVTQPTVQPTPAPTVDPIKQDVESLKADQQRRMKQEIDQEFASFYEAYPEAKEKEAELVEIAKPLWRTQVGGKFKYGQLREALQDAYFLSNKEQFMEKSKLDALTEVQKQAGAAQSLLGSSSKKTTPVKHVQLTPEQRRVAQRFIDKGVFKDEQDYINSLKE